MSSMPQNGLNPRRHTLLAVPALLALVLGQSAALLHSLKHEGAGAPTQHTVCLECALRAAGEPARRDHADVDRRRAGGLRSVRSFERPSIAPSTRPRVPFLRPASLKRPTPSICRRTAPARAFSARRFPMGKVRST